MAEKEGSLVRKKSRWAVVLSGGEGERLRAMTEKWLGAHRPKQYCAFVGSRTMLDHTLDRATAIAGKDRIVTVIGRGHRSFVDVRSMPGKVIEQPANMDTAPGIYVGMSYVASRDPDATVVIFPSDHFVSPESRFLEYVERAVLLAERLPDRLVILGAHSDRPETEFGWIEPGNCSVSWSWSSRHRAHQVASFREKPSVGEAREFFARGFLWNTMIMAVKLPFLRSLGEAFVPRVVERLDVLTRFWGGSPADPLTLAEQEVLNLLEAYQGLPRANFSRDVVQRCPGCAVVLPMAGVEWSDWGKPERIGETLRRLAKGSTVPLEFLAAAAR